MRPISVRFKCFGPYIEEQFVDFTQLEPSGLFLICGETGAGKTTILDAMCYALYGRSSGGLRGDITVMRCKQASPSEESFVEFIFESNGSRYRFFRSFKPKKKRKAKGEEDGAEDKKKVSSPEYNLTCECQIIENGEFVPLADTKDKATFLNSKAAELIGLTYDQFRQVIILPQGQFEKLLVSNSEEKEKILVTLFHAERWHKMAEKMHEEAMAHSRELDNESSIIRSRLDSYECSSTAELKDKVKAAAESIEKIKVEQSEAEKQVNDCKKRLETALLENQAFEQKEKLRAEAERLSRQIEKYRQESEILARADKADVIAPAYAEYKNALSKVLECNNVCRSAEEALHKADSALKEVMLMQQRHEERRPGYNRGKERAVLLENSRELYRTLGEKKTTADAASKALEDAEKLAKTAADEYKSAVDRWEKALEAQQLARVRQQEAQRCYLEGIGSILAQRLVEGERCPVCGSLSHPDPAQAAEEHITDAQLEELSKAMKSANDREDAARRSRSEAEKKNAAVQEMLAHKKQEAAVARAEYERALSMRIEGVEDAAQLEKELSRLISAIKDYEDEDGKMQERIASAKGSQQAAQNGVESAQKALAAASQEMEQKKTVWVEMRDNAGFEDDEKFSEASIAPSEKNERHAAVIQFKTDYANARNAYELKVKELEGKEAPDIAEIKKLQQSAEQNRDDINRRLTLAVQQCERMSKDADELEKRSQTNMRQRIESDEKLMFAKRLRGDFGISLQRYVLGVMLTSITAAANRLLKTVYSGRYQLHRTNEAAGSSRKRGLELEVYDANNNERRSVTTLSGGEKFLVALSLAIGLSTVVQAQGSGVRLEAMFIDEGFGSLDRESVNDALEVLQGIRRSSGIVGIISHVDQLAETIPAKIQITKQRSGSKCEIIC